MAKLRNIAGEARYIPLAGGMVDDGEEFELDDLEFYLYAFSPELFKIVEPPTIKNPNPSPDDDPRPAKNAKTEEWADFAVTVRGANPEDVEGKTRDELIEKYGQE